MKKFLLFLLVLVVGIFLATQFLLPNYVESRIEQEINKSLQPDSQVVNVEVQPGFKLLYGEADQVSGSLKNVRLGKLNFANFDYDAKQILINPVSLIANQELDVISVGKASIDGVITSADLSAFLSEQAGNTIKDVKVNIGNDKITLSGDMNVGMVFRGTTQLEGALELKGNTLVFAPKRFTLNGATIPGFTSGILETTEIYDFNTFPIPVKAERIDVTNGEIHIKVIPVLK